jgi:predicted ribosomally synthesized peptide with SipW-like signal peptide
MKMTKKKVFVVALAVCLVAIISMGTLAWFTATGTVDNKFQVSTATGEQYADFKLEIFETKVLPDGTLGTDEVNANEYTHIAPGDELDKDPTVRNAGQYDMWVRINVTLDNYTTWEDVFGQGYDFSTILTGVSAEWTLDATSVGTNTLVFYKNTVLAPTEESTLFTGVKIPTEFTVENMPTEFNLKVVGEAIQAANTGTTAQQAFLNF